MAKTIPVNCTCGREPAVDEADVFQVQCKCGRRGRVDIAWDGAVKDWNMQINSLSVSKEILSIKPTGKTSTFILGLIDRLKGN